MSYAKELLADLYQSCPDQFERRKNLTENMQNLAKNQIGCQSCPGHCCTFEYNAMQVDPVQALELYSYLEESELLTDQLVERLNQFIKDYRLDYAPYLGTKKTFKRYYTCPFFKAVEGSGCPIDVNFKPYGCLAYNATEKDVSEQGKCNSQIDILKFREEKFEKYESDANDSIRKSLGIYWDKKPLPVALVDILKSVKEKNEL